MLNLMVIVADGHVMIIISMLSSKNIRNRNAANNKNKLNFLWVLYIVEKTLKTLGYALSNIFVSIVILILN